MHLSGALPMRQQVTCVQIDQPFGSRRGTDQPRAACSHGLQRTAGGDGGSGGTLRNRRPLAGPLPDRHRAGRDVRNQRRRRNRPFRSARDRHTVERGSLHRGLRRNLQRLAERLGMERR